MKILIMGLPGSGKSTLARPFAELIGGIWINADNIRHEYNDWDFSIEGRIKQAHRMRDIARGVELSGKIAIADFVCPTEELRKIFSANYTVWVDTIKESRYQDTNAIFEKPSEVNYHVSEWFNNTDRELAKVVTDFIQRKK
jgi:adenylylsulfate kinase